MSRTKGSKNKIDKGTHLECLFCGASFRVRSYRTKIAKFCSRSCLAKYYKPHTKHMGSKTPLFRHWCHMKTRCYNPRWHAYHRYGGRGIKVCDEWLYDFATFRHWAKANGFVKGLTLDRRNNNKGYYPKNCRWIPANENVRGPVNEPKTT